MSENKIDLPTPVLEHPHWRVNFRPAEYREDMISSLGKCFEIIEKTKLRLRGWDYPHLSGREAERGQGTNWVYSWSDFLGSYEYWRFYQSGQFLHLFSIREAIESEWREKLQREMQSHRILSDGEIDWESVPGFFQLSISLIMSQRFSNLRLVFLSLKYILENYTYKSISKE